MKLSKGNYLNYNGQPMRVTAIYSDNDVELDNCITTDDYEPIDITEEILLKCEGIEKYSTHANGTMEYQFNHKKPSKHIVVRVNKYEPITLTLFNHSECDFTQLQFIKRIEYLHELQNGFEFTAEKELKVNLTQ